MKKTIDVNPCPVCTHEHKGLELPEVTMYDNATKQSEAVLTCPETGKQFTITIDGYEH